MSTTIHMRCGGCAAEKEVPYERTFRSFDGKGYGFGVYHVPTVEQAVEPTGWVLFDLIGCTYCPKCWAEIEAGEDDPVDEASNEEPGNVWRGADVPFADNH